MGGDDEIQSICFVSDFAGPCLVFYSARYYFIAVDQYDYPEYFYASTNAYRNQHSDLNTA